MPTKIKFCGLTRAEDVDFAVSLGVWALGFNFYAPSPRSVTPELAKTLIERVPASVLTVGVFVGESREKISEIVNLCRLDAIQLCGKVSPAECSGWGSIETIAALSLAPGTLVDPAMLASYQQAANYLLFDGYAANLAGGTGQLVGESLAADSAILNLLGNFILAGGLTAENVAERTKLFSPFAVDVASGIESEPGIKDRELMQKFAEATKGSASNLS